MVSPTSLPALAVSETGAGLDLARLAFLTEIFGRSGSPATIGELVDAFVEDGHLRLEAMGRCLGAGDLASVAGLAHELKGSSGTIGAVALCDAVSGLHRRALASAGGEAGTPPEVDDVEQWLDLTRLEFRRAELALRSAVQGPV